MKALLVISHGSRRAASNEEVSILTDKLRQKAGTAIPLVACAFLEITEPKVQSAIDGLAAQGATEILVFPHFLAAGTHVARDIPRELDAAGSRHPGLSFKLLPHLGALPGLATLILDRLPPPEIL